MTSSFFDPREYEPDELDSVEWWLDEEDRRADFDDQGGERSFLTVYADENT